MAVGSFNVPLAKEHFVPVGVLLNQQHAPYISSVKPTGLFKSTHLSKNKTLVVGSKVCSFQNILNSVSILVLPSRNSS